MMSPKHKSKGFSIVELIVAAAIIVSVGTAAVGLWQAYLRLTTTSAQTSQAALITEEAAEAIQILRDNSWTSFIAPLTAETPYYLYWNGTFYATSTTPVAISGPYAVNVVFSSVSRDAATNNIVSSGGVLDTHTRSAVISVVSASSTSQVISQSSLLIHDIFHN